MNPWKKQTEVGSSIGLWFLFIIFKIFGSFVCKIFMSPVLLYFYLFKKNTRQSINIFYQKLSSNTGNKYGYFYPIKNFLNFGYGIIDRLSIWNNKIPISQINPINEESIYSYMDKNIGGIIVVSHLGNFEISRVASKNRTLAVMNIIVDSSNAKKIQKIMQATNNDYDFNLISVDNINMQTIILLQEKVELGEFLVIAGDRITDKQSNTIEANFLGDKAKFPIGPYVLAKVLGCPVFNICCLKNNNKYDVYFELLFEKIKFNSRTKDETLKLCVAKYTSTLEKYVKKAPTQWYNFYNFWSINE